LRTLLHAREPERARAACLDFEATAVVPDLEVQAPVAGAQGHRDPPGIGVADRVQQRLLCHPIDRKLHVLLEARNLRREDRGERRVVARQSIRQRAQAVPQAVFVEPHRPQLVRHAPQMLDHLREVPSHPREIHLDVRQRGAHAQPNGLHEDADAQQLLTDVVMEIEAEPLALLLANRDLPLRE